MKKLSIVFASLLLSLNAFAFPPAQIMALQALESMPTQYGYRNVCISGQNIIGAFSDKPGTSNEKNYYMVGDVVNFPEGYEVFDPRKNKGPVISPNIPNTIAELRNLSVLKTKTKDTGLTVYYTTGTMGKYAADCAFEGPSLK